MRKAIKQIALSPGADTEHASYPDTLYVLCEDSTLWVRSMGRQNSQVWVKVEGPSLTPEEVMEEHPLIAFVTGVTDENH